MDAGYSMEGWADAGVQHGGGMRMQGYSVERVCGCGGTEWRGYADVGVQHGGVCRCGGTA